jgi:hypothetical protein
VEAATVWSEALPAVVVRAARTQADTAAVTVVAVFLTGGRQVKAMRGDQSCGWRRFALIVVGVLQQRVENVAESV